MLYWLKKQEEKFKLWIDNFFQWFEMGIKIKENWFHIFCLYIIFQISFFIKKRRNWPRVISALTWLASSLYFCFSLGPRAYHHSPRILLTVLLSWFGCRWWTKCRCLLLNIIKAFMGLLMWSLSFDYNLWKLKLDIAYYKIQSDLYHNV